MVGHNLDNTGSGFDHKMKIFIVIAAYNEEKSIHEVVEDLNKNGYNNIVIVDDGSKDDTYAVISRLPVHALKHFMNRGQGAALKTGIDYALRQGADYVVTFDADGQHHADEISSMLKALKKHKVDVALGSRFLKKDVKVPAFRKIMLKLGIFVTWIFYGVKLTDSHNGFRVLSRKAARMIDITSDRMEHASQIVEEIKKKKLRYVEVPVTITYTDYSMAKGQSSWNSIKIGFRMIFRKFLK